MCVYPCHPETSVAIFLKMSDWFWHYDPTLNSMFLTGQAQVCIYTFFSRSFAVTMLNSQFDLEFLFDGVPLHMAYLVFDSPPPSPTLDKEMDTLEKSSPVTST